MKTFEYRGFDGDGRRARGLIEADSPKHARELLARRGLMPETLTPAGDAAGGGRWTRGIDRAAVCRELAALQAAGLPLSQAMDILIESPEWTSMRPVLAGIRDRIREGASPADAFAASGVGALETAVLHAGQRAGALADSLRRIAEVLEEDTRIRERVRSALVYPVLVSTLALLIAGGIFGFLLPSFARLFEEARVPLPALTRGVLAFGRAAGLLGPPLLAAAAAAAAWERRRWRAAAEVRVRWDRFQSRLPVVAGAREAMVGLRFSRTLSLLLRGGIPLLEALQLAADASGSAWAAREMTREVESIRHGGTVREAIRRIEPLRRTLGPWIEAGEQSGDLPGMLDVAAARCEEVWNRRLARALALLEPALILVLGAMVFVLAMAILLPILALNRPAS